MPAKKNSRKRRSRTKKTLKQRRRRSSKRTPKKRRSSSKSRNTRKTRRRSSKKKNSRGIAIKSNPRLWERAKRAACSQGKLCKHSARKMQWATSWYKSHGGRYKGKKSSSNRLVKWSRQKWRTSSGKKSLGKRRYLPDKAWRALTPSQRRRANASKRKGFSKGRQYVRNPKDVAKVSKKYRK